MKQDEYLDLIKKTLGTTKATDAVKKAALNILFPGKGSMLLSILKDSE